MIDERNSIFSKKNITKENSKSARLRCFFWKLRDFNVSRSRRFYFCWAPAEQRLNRKTFTSLNFLKHIKLGENSNNVSKNWLNFFQSELFRYRQLFILQNVLISLESNWKGISNNNRWHNDSAQNRKFDFCRALNTSRIYFLNSTTWSSSPALMENACAHASNFLNLLANYDRIISPDLSSSMLSVVERALVFIAVSVDCTIQTATPTFES